MTAIVRCVGRKEITVDYPGPGVTRTRFWQPCGWKSPEGTALNFCPNCGGEVELIPTSGDP